MTGNAPATARTARSAREAAIPRAALLIVLVGAALYANSLRVPFLFDDLPSIVENPSIRSLGSLRSVFAPPGHLTVGGRPVVNLTFAVNYALGGTGVSGYHLGNLVIHLLAALALFGVVRRSLLSPLLRGRFAPAEAEVALAASLLWVAHPLQTEAVTYIAQRVESLASLFYLLALYAAIRAAESAGHARRWQAASVAACLLGVGSKEICATAPLLILLHDRTFLAGSLREAWQRRRGFYVALAATWLPLAALIHSTGSRGGTAGFDTGVPWLRYALTQFGALVRYLSLSLWPAGLVFDYGEALSSGAGAVAPAALVVIALLGLTAYGLVRRPPLGFLGAFFFAVLAPSSSVVPVRTQTIAEHRMYLPLAAIAVLAAAAVYRAAQRAKISRVLPRVLLGLGLAALGTATVMRNEVYRDERTLLEDVVRKRPQNARAWSNLGNVLSDAGQVPEGLAALRTAVALQPAEATYHYNLGTRLGRLGRYGEAIDSLGAAVRLAPGFVSARRNLGNALLEAGSVDGAIAEYERALALEPDSPSGHNSLGTALVERGDLEAAVRHYERALALAPEYVVARLGLAAALAATGRRTEAARELARALAWAEEHGDDVLAREIRDRLDAVGSPSP